MRKREARDVDPDRRMQTCIVLCTCAVLAASLMDPHFPQEQLLQHIPTVPSMVVILVGVRRGWWSTLSILCLMMFAMLHILGARFVYSCVPYDQLLHSLTGWSVNEAFGWERNHYDRLVHLLFGVLLPLPVAELLARRSNIRPFDNVFLTISFVTAVGAIYEILEWLAAVVMSPEMAESYNGQQGDMWDPQKDLAMAFIGSLLVAVPVWWKMRQQRKSFLA